MAPIADLLIISKNIKCKGKEVLKGTSEKIRELNQPEKEIILAQEQSVVNKSTRPGISEEPEGTLILTSQRLIFVGGNKSLVSMGQTSESLTYADVEELSDISRSERNLFIELSSVDFASGHKGLLGPPYLKITWKDADGKTRATEFQQIVTGRERKKNLNEWASVIEKIKSGNVSLNLPSELPNDNTLEGRIYKVMGDFQTKGSLQIEDEVESKYEVELEPDDVEASCAGLVSKGLLVKVLDSSGELFYKRCSVLPDELDLSS